MTNGKFKKGIEELQSKSLATQQTTDLDVLDFCQTLRLKSGKFSFEKRQYLKDILTDKSKTIVVRKGRQVGMTVTAVALIIYNALKYPGTTHIYATADDKKIRYFSLDNFMPTIEQSRIELKHGRTDKILTNYRFPNGSVLFLITDHDGWTQARGISADFCYLDEIQEGDLTKLPNVLETMAMSKHQRAWIFGTGSYEGSEWQKFYGRTDQKEWEDTWVKTAESKVSGYWLPQYFMPNWSEEVESLKRNQYSPAEYTMEVEGGFATGLAVPLPYSIAMKCFKSNDFLTPSQVKKQGKRIASLDLAAGGEADTVLTISQYHEGHLDVVFAENYQDERASVLFNKIDNRLKEWQPEIIASDAGGNNELLYMLNENYDVTAYRHTASKDNISYKEGQSEVSINKSFMTQRTISRFTENTISIPTPNPNWLIDQLTAESAETIHSAGGGSTIRFSKLKDRKDDFLQSLIFAEAAIFASEDSNNPDNREWRFTDPDDYP